MFSISDGQCVESEFEIKKSRFITQVYRVNNVAEAREKIILAKKQYPDARHHCTAFNVYENNIEIFRSNDDGEPAGTAGKPMLEALKGSGLKNVVFIAIRYFGGIKLGTGGLVNAYTKCVQDGIKACFKNNRVVEIITTNTYIFTIDLILFGKVSAELYNNKFNIKDTIFDDNNVKFILAIPDEEFENSIKILSSILQDNVVLEKHGISTTEIYIDSIAI